MKRPREKTSSNGAVLVNRAQLAAIFAISPNQVTKWTNERGMPVERIGGGRGHPSEYDLVKVFAWWRVEFDAGKNGGRDRYYNEMTVKVAMQNALARGEVHSIEVCSEQVGALVTAAKEGFRSLPDWCQQVGIVTSHAEYDALAARIWETLNELSGGAASALERRYGVVKPSSEQLVRELKRDDETKTGQDDAADKT